MNYLYQGFPLVRMNTAVTQGFFFKSVRAQLAKNWLRKHGPQGVGLCNPKLQLIAFLRPNGTVQELSPPFKEFAMWQMANAPPVQSRSEQTCACAGYFDPEVGGPWAERGLPPNHHHPFCQFARTAQQVFDVSKASAENRVREGRATAQERPDEWIRRQKQAES